MLSLSFDNDEHPHREYIYTNISRNVLGEVRTNVDIYRNSLVGKIFVHGGFIFAMKIGSLNYNFY